MPGFERFANAAVAINRIELVQKIRKRQFNTSGLTVREQMSMPYV
jgi:hypothetical protein